MARSPEGGEQISLSTFVSLIKKGQKDRLLNLGADATLDYFMDAIGQYRDRGTAPVHTLFKKYFDAKLGYNSDAFSTVWVEHTVSFLDEVGFSRADIEDAFKWYFSIDTDFSEEDKHNMTGLQAVISKAFMQRGWTPLFGTVH